MIAPKWSGCRRACSSKDRAFCHRPPARLIEAVIGRIFRQVLDQDPGYARAAFNLGVVYYELGEVELAERHWAKVLESAPDSDLALQAEENLTTLRSAEE